MAKKRIVSMPFSKIKAAIALVLKDEGYIADINKKTVANHNVIELTLKYYADVAVIESIIRVSKPGLRIYKPASKIPEVMNGLGIAIISTSKGVMTGKKAQEAGVGGEVLCEVV